MATTKDKMEFAYEMAKHSNVRLGQIERLLRFGTTLNRLAVKQCNEPWTERDERKRDHIKAHLLACVGIWEGVTGFVFSNDPRGACLKVKVADGFTNDWGREGICVPTS